MIRYKRPSLIYLSTIFWNCVIAVGKTSNRNCAVGLLKDYSIFSALARGALHSYSKPSIKYTIQFHENNMGDVMGVNRIKLYTNIYGLCALQRLNHTLMSKCYKNVSISISQHIESLHFICSAMYLFNEMSVVQWALYCYWSVISILNNQY